ncbi:diguanylate cyclase [Roseicella aquatilis]|uniref:diguanylate cyclase n=1 Tax=Roseicella aquatilis TaxID=2527868 RepID=A0A4R4DKE9_9PROT|nr:diguanylate cyclase [Roseicella aquatilis]TCZ60886.1 diguanylate cyclase [Roseicella aquatilis]
MSWLLHAAAGLLALGVLLLGGVGLQQSRAEAWERARIEGSNLAQSLGREIGRSLDAVALAVEAVVDRLAEPRLRELPPQQRQLALFDRAATARGLDAILVLDAAGHVVEDSRPGPPRQGDVADRDTFHVPAADPGRGIVIGVPVQDRLGDGWLLPLSRAIRAADGSFAGAVVGTIDLGAWQDLLASIHLGPHGSIGLIREDGTLVLRNPRRDGEIGHALATDWTFRRFLAGGPEQVTATSSRDGVERLFTFRRIPGTPFLLAIVFASRDIEAGWRSRAWGLVLPLAAVLVLLAVATVLLSRELRRRQAAERLLAEAADQARRKAELLAAVTGCMDQGLAAWGADGILLACNARYSALLDLPEGLAVPGRHYLDIARHVAARGEYGPGDPETLALARYAAASRGNGHRHTRIRPDGRVLHIVGRSRPGGGFVTTFSDVTEARAAEVALRESEARFRLLAENSGDMVGLADLRGRRRYVSPASERVLGWMPDQVEGHSVFEFAHPEDTLWVEAALDALQSGDPEASVTYRHRRPDGSYMWVESHCRAHADAAAGLGAGYVVVIRDATERKRAEAELLRAYERMEIMATTDALTGLANRRRFEAALETEWRRCAREAAPLSAIVLDVDHFKRFNDRYGHPGGDSCLRQVAAVLQAAARRPPDLAARTGGEEFTVLLPATGREGAASVAERLRKAVRDLAVPHAGNPPAGVVTISLGVATAWPQPDNDPAAQQRARDALISAADGALYAAKAAGRDHVALEGAVAPDRQSSLPETVS